MNTILNGVDWVEVAIHLPLWVSVFGLGLCLQGLVMDWRG